MASKTNKQNNTNENSKTKKNSILGKLFGNGNGNKKPANNNVANQSTTNNVANQSTTNNVANQSTTNNVATNNVATNNVANQSTTNNVATNNEIDQNNPSNVYSTNTEYTNSNEDGFIESEYPESPFEASVLGYSKKLLQLRKNSSENLVKSNNLLYNARVAKEDSSTIKQYTKESKQYKKEIAVFTSQINTLSNIASIPNKITKISEDLKNSIDNVVSASQQGKSTSTNYLKSETKKLYNLSSKFTREHKKMRHDLQKLEYLITKGYVNDDFKDNLTSIIKSGYSELGEAISSLTDTFKSNYNITTKKIQMRKNIRDSIWGFQERYHGVSKNLNKFIELYVDIARYNNYVKKKSDTLDNASIALLDKKENKKDGLKKKQYNKNKQIFAYKASRAAAILGEKETKKLIDTKVKENLAISIG
jgi:hypothetical protein